MHLSIQDNHVHLLVEAGNRMALARGMQAFQISAAKHINAAVSKAGSWWERRKLAVRPKRRKGSVFPDRYHEEIIRTPRQARNALAYVLNNWRKHREHTADYARRWLIDPFSTGWSSTAGRSARTSRSCGRCARATSRSRAGGRGRGCCARAGAATGS